MVSVSNSCVSQARCLTVPSVCSARPARWATGEYSALMMSKYPRSPCTWTVQGLRRWLAVRLPCVSKDV